MPAVPCSGTNSGKRGRRRLEVVRPVCIERGGQHSEAALWWSSSTRALTRDEEHRWRLGCRWPPGEKAAFRLHRREGRNGTGCEVDRAERDTIGSQAHRGERELPDEESVAVRPPSSDVQGSSLRLIDSALLVVLQGEENQFALRDTGRTAGADEGDLPPVRRPSKRLDGTVDDWPIGTCPRWIVQKESTID